MALDGFPRNILIIITDQERRVQHWPDGWIAEHQPSMQRLMDNGLTFTNGYNNSCTCSPSRTTLFTGVYPAQHGVTEVLEFDPSTATDLMQHMLPSQYQNMAKILKTAGYNVVYKGKWHLTKPARFSEPLDSLYWSQDDVDHIANRWGFDGWNYPDAGDDLQIPNMGGGKINNDGRFVDGIGQAAKYGVVPNQVEESAVYFLDNYDKRDDSDKPFCLIVSLVNPHDVLAYPNTYEAAGYDLNDFRNLDIPLPETVNEDLITKPRVQAEFRSLCNYGIGPITEGDTTDQLYYGNFYAYLSTEVDKEIGKVLAALDDKPGRTDDTLIVRISDHGEMAMAHGRQRQKMYNVYQETINVPMIFSNPRMYPEPKVTESFGSLIDILPTLANIANVPEPDRWTFKGKDLTPILEDHTAEVQDYVHFTFDDTWANVPGANHIRCITEKVWKYAVYYDISTGEKAEYEMYDRLNDPLEETNLAVKTPPEFEQERQRLHEKLILVMEELGTTPYQIIFPPVSGVDDPRATFYEPQQTSTTNPFSSIFGKNDSPSVLQDELNAELSLSKNLVSSMVSSSLVRDGSSKAGLVFGTQSGSKLQVVLLKDGDMAGLKAKIEIWINEDQPLRVVQLSIAYGGGDTRVMLIYQPYAPGVPSVGYSVDAISENSAGDMANAVNDVVTKKSEVIADSTFANGKYRTVLICRPKEDITA